MNMGHPLGVWITVFGGLCEDWYILCWMVV
jgi:hypothetical protein